jgi:hypothetical protein
VEPIARTEYRFSWWHQGLMIFDHDYEWSDDSHEITDIEMSAWIAQDPTRSVTFVAPCGELFGSAEAPLTVEVLAAEPAVESSAESVGDLDLVVTSGRLDLLPSGGGEGPITIDVPIGEWRARWSGFGEQVAIEQAYPSDVLQGAERPDRYLLQLWPSEFPAGVIVRRG